MRLLLPILAIVLLLGSCGSSGTGSGQDQGIRGVVLLGPVCPIESAESPCPPRPLVDTMVEVSNGSGDVVATTRTDRQGRFEVHVDPGVFSVAAVLVTPGPPSSHPVRVTVRPHAFAEVTVPVDSGIR